MGDLAEVVDRGFRVGTLEFTIGRTHAAHGFDTAIRAFGCLKRYFLPLSSQMLVTAFLKAALTQVIEIG